MVLTQSPSQMRGNTSESLTGRDLGLVNSSFRCSKIGKRNFSENCINHEMQPRGGRPSEDARETTGWERAGRCQETDIALLRSISAG